MLNDKLSEIFELEMIVYQVETGNIDMHLELFNHYWIRDLRTNHIRYINEW